MVVDSSPSPLATPEEELPTEAAVLIIALVPLESLHSSSTEDRARKGLHDPDRPAAKGWS
jgi:hypothetical protein